MIEQVKKALKKIQDDKLYSPEDIFEMGVIMNTKLVPSVFSVYRLIKSKKLQAVNIGTGTKSRHFVKGSDLKQYLKSTYQL